MAKKEATKKHKHSDDADNVAKITVDKRSRTDRKADGKAMRLAVPLARHAAWQIPAHRRDPIELLIESGVGRVPELLPIRYGRMLQSPFTFYRGGSGNYGCGSCRLAENGHSGTSLRRLPFGQFRQFRYPRTAADIRYQRLR